MVELSEETLMVLHNGCGSNRNFCKKDPFGMIDDNEILMNSNYHGKTTKFSKHKIVWALGPFILLYAMRKTVELCGAMRDDSYKAGNKPDREAEVRGDCILCPLPTPKGEGRESILCPLPTPKGEGRERELRVRGKERLRLMNIRLRCMTAILP